MIEVSFEDNIALIQFNRPEKLNAFDFDGAKRFSEVMEELSAREDLRGIILWGAGKAFSAGGDVSLMKEFIDKGDYEGYLGPVLPFLNKGITLLSKIPVPTVAVIHGAAAGAGFSIATACDYRVLTPKAKFVVAFINIGLTCDTSLSWHLPRILGYAKAFELITLSPRVDAEKAMEIGLGTKLVNGDVEEAVKEAKSLILSRPPRAFKRLKELLRDSMNTSLEEQLKKEEKSMLESAKDPEHHEGVNAMLEKRKPQW